LVEKSCGAEGIMQMNALPILNANRERQLTAGQSGNGGARSWPIASVEFSDVPNYVNFTARQRSRSAAA
jgi:hypothetical protein